MKTVLAFGDSLTWGYRPEDGTRHPFDMRWPNVLAAGLDGAQVVAEGLPGRMTAHNNGAGACDLNGAGHLPVLLHSHKPLDLVVVMLGTNDIYYGLAPERAGDGLRRVVEVIRHHPYRQPLPALPDILLVAPPPLVPSPINGRVTADVIARSKQLPAIVEQVAVETSAHWIDAGQFATTADTDGIHLDAENTAALGRGLIAPVKTLLGL